MKKSLILLSICSAVLLTSCGTSSYYASSGFEDGIYYRASEDARDEARADSEKVGRLIEQTKKEAARFSDTIIIASPNSQLELQYTPRTQYTIMFDDQLDSLGQVNAAAPSMSAIRGRTASLSGGARAQASGGRTSSVRTFQTAGSSANFGERYVSRGSLSSYRSDAGRTSTAGRTAAYNSGNTFRRTSGAATSAYRRPAGSTSAGFRSPFEGRSSVSTSFSTGGRRLESGASINGRGYNSRSTTINRSSYSTGRSSFSTGSYSRSSSMGVRSSGGGGGTRSGGGGGVRR